MISSFEVAWSGKTATVILFAFISFGALREYATLSPTRRADHWALVVSFFIVLPFQYFLVWIDWYGLYSIMIPVYAFLLLPILAVLAGDTTRSQWSQAGYNVQDGNVFFGLKFARPFLY